MSLRVGTGGFVDVLVEPFYRFSSSSAPSSASADDERNGRRVRRPNGGAARRAVSYCCLDAAAGDGTPAADRRQQQHPDAREFLATTSRRFVCIIDAKRVATPRPHPLPVEVVPMAHSYVSRQLVEAGGQPVRREKFVTDDGNHFLDVHDLPITNPPSSSHGSTRSRASSRWRVRQSAANILLIGGVGASSEFGQPRNGPAERAFTSVRSARGD